MYIFQKCSHFLRKIVSHWILHTTFSPLRGEGQAQGPLNRHLIYPLDHVLGCYPWTQSYFWLESLYAKQDATAETQRAQLRQLRPWRRLATGGCGWQMEDKWRRRTRASRRAVSPRRKAIGRNRHHRHHHNIISIQQQEASSSWCETADDTRVCFYFSPAIIIVAGLHLQVCFIRSRKLLLWQKLSK